MGHLPVRDVHLLIIPQGQRERDSVTGCKDSGDVGLHHLQGRSKVCIGGVCTLRKQKQGTALELPRSPGTQGQASARLWDPQVGLEVAFLSFKADLTGRDPQHPSASGLLVKKLHRPASRSPS